MTTPRPRGHADRQPEPRPHPRTARTADRRASCPRRGQHRTGGKGARGPRDRGRRRRRRRVLPAAAADPIATALAALGLSWRTVPVPTAVRATYMRPAGRHPHEAEPARGKPTEPTHSTPPPPPARARCRSRKVRCPDRSPPATPDDWYGELVADAADTPAGRGRTREVPLPPAAGPRRRAGPVKLSAEELAQLGGVTRTRSCAAPRRPDRRARPCRRRGVAAVLANLGAYGVLLSLGEGAGVVRPARRSPPAARGRRRLRLARTCSPTWPGTPAGRAPAQRGRLRRGRRRCPPPPSQPRPDLRRRRTASPLRPVLPPPTSPTRPPAGSP